MMQRITARYIDMSLLITPKNGSLQFDFFVRDTLDSSYSSGIHVDMEEYRGLKCPNLSEK